MKTILLLLLSLSLCAADLAWPAEKDTPPWAKELNKAWEAAWGPAAPKNGTVPQAQAEASYFKLFDAAFINWAPRANLQPLANEGGKDAEYNGMVAGLRNAVKRRPLTARDAVDMHHNDRWFLRYIEAHKDPQVLVFLWSPDNRAKYPRAVE